ncbi:MAG: tetratricopeptide repeat protein, partial [Elusimicrobia bacterium]|nr:tetratricopeptide repeat protein [Elusimicrobiota bacterium]
KYRDFLKNYPASKLKNAAVFRIGAALFSKREYADAQANFQNIIDRSQRDSFAPLAQYFIAEAYLAGKQTQNALFAYTKLTDNYPASSVSPAARYKLAWCRYLMNDYLPAARA